MLSDRKNHITGLILVFCVASPISSASAQISSQAYGYDAMGRLVSVKASSGQRTEYVYDAAGNRQAVIVAGEPMGPIDWPDASVSTTEMVGAVLTDYQSITGVDENQNLRFSVAYSGNLDAGSFNVFSATRNRFIATLPLGSGNLDVSVHPQEVLNLYSDAMGVAGQRNGQWAVTVTNQTAGGTFVDNVLMSIAVNVPDLIIEGIEFVSANNVTGNTQGEATVVNGGDFAQGINRPVQLCATVDPLYRGGSAQSYFTVYVGTGSASWNAGEVDPKTFCWTIQPGDFVGASAALSQFNAGDAWAYWHVEIVNVSAGQSLGDYNGGLHASR